MAGEICESCVAIPMVYNVLLRTESPKFASNML